MRLLLLVIIFFIITVALPALSPGMAAVAPAHAAGVPAAGFTLRDLEIDRYWIDPDVSYIWKYSASERVSATDGTNTFKVDCIYRDKNNISSNFIMCIFTVNRKASDQQTLPEEILTPYQEVRNTCTDDPGYYNVEQVLNEENKSFSVMRKSIDQYTGKPLYYGERLFYNGYDYCSMVFSLLPGSEQEARAAADAVQSKVYEAWGGPTSEQEATLEITHNHPFSPEVLNNPARYPGGEIIVRLKDEKGNGVNGKTVYLFVEKFYDEQTVWGRQPAEVLVFDRPHCVEEAMGRYPLPYFNWLEPVGAPPADTWYGGYTVLTTDSNGFARYNYLESGFLYFDRLEKYLLRDGKAYVKVWAIVLDQEIPPPGVFTYYGKTFNAVASDSITIEFDGVAAIKNIGTTNTGSEPMVRVMRTDPASGAPAGTQSVRTSDLPYELLPGSYILMDQDDRVEVRWISGHKVLSGVKPGFIDHSHALAKLYIGAKDTGWYRWASGQANLAAVAGGIAADGVWWLIWAPEAAELAVTGAAPVGFAAGWWLGEKYSDPILIVPQSTVLFDYEEERARISLLEGKVLLVNAKNETTKLAPGQVINVSRSGEFGPMEAFVETALSPGQKDAIKEIQAAQEASGGQATGAPVATGGRRIFMCPLVAIAIPLLLIAILFAQKKMPRR